MWTIAKSEQGFTLLELLVAVAIVGILSSIAIPAYAEFRDKGSAARAVTELRNLQTAFMSYEAINGDYPSDSHSTLPSGMEDFISASSWPLETPFGGWYNWEGPDNYPYAGISLFGTTGTTEQIEALDSLIDNGDLGSGRFRTTPNGRYTYIIEE